MDLIEKIAENIQRLRKERNVTQEILASALEISVQAVSKWETGASLPDIMQLPRIAKFFGVTIDYLFYNEGKNQQVINDELPDDDTLRIVQFRGNKMLGHDTWDQDKSINLKIPDFLNGGDSKIVLNTEIWGKAVINGNIGGNAECGSELNCGNIGGNVECRTKLNCGDIGGNVECSGEMHCKEIKGDVTCEGNIIYDK